MKPNNVDEELPFVTKVKIVGTMSLVTVALMASAVGYTSYQRNAKIEAAQLAKTQTANIAKAMTVFPVYRETKEFKEIEEKTMVKVNQNSLPATITAGLDASVSPNPGCDTGGFNPGDWQLVKDGIMIAGVILGDEEKNGFEVSDGGNISIPANAAYGKYNLVYVSNETCVDGAGVDGHPKYNYVFKIVPPCPTVTLTATSTYHSGSGSG